jgi:hypothetical protein
MDPFGLLAASWRMARAMVLPFLSLN